MRKLLSLAVLSLLLVTPAAAGTRVLLSPPNSDAERTTLQALRAVAADRGSVRVIVGLKVPFAPEGDLAASERQQQRQDISAAVSQLSGRFAAAIARDASPARSFAAIPFMVLDVTPGELERLALDEATLSLAEDTLLRAAPLSVASRGASTVPTAYPASTTLIGAPTAWSSGVTGTDQVIAVIGDGVYANHEILKGKVVSEACYSQAGNCIGKTKSATGTGTAVPLDPAYSEGTTIASLAAGNGDKLASGGKFRSGVAKDAKLVAINVSSISSDGIFGIYLSDIVSGLSRVYQLSTQQKMKIAAVVAPYAYDLEFQTYGSPCDATFPAAAAAVNTLRAAGIAMVATSGDKLSTTGMFLPACLSGTISVAAVSATDWGSCSFTAQKTAADKVYCLANTSPGLTLFAPGAPVSGATANGQYATSAGSGFAAAHVAGAFALLRQKYPASLVGENLIRLTSTGKKVTGERYGKGNAPQPRIDVAAALTASAVTLTVTKTGRGTGTVSFKPPGDVASCRAPCTASFVPGVAVTATFKADPGSTFTSWTGCTGKPSCTVTLKASTTITANVSAP